MSKLTDAKALVDDLKQKAGEQSRQLAEKQEEADAALREITASMQVRTGCFLASIAVFVWARHATLPPIPADVSWENISVTSLITNAMDRLD